VASGFATGAGQGVSATPIHYIESTSSSPLALTGAPVDTLAATGLALVIVGLLLSFDSVPRWWRRTRRPDQAQ
jgi:hypothetical protein